MARFGHAGGLRPVLPLHAAHPPTQGLEGSFRGQELLRDPLRGRVGARRGRGVVVWFDPAVADAAHHGERWKGRGYVRVAVSRASIVVFPRDVLARKSGGRESAGDQAGGGERDMREAGGRLRVSARAVGRRKTGAAPP